LRATCFSGPTSTRSLSVSSERMKTYLECIPCFIKQSLEAARMATDDEDIHEKVLKEVMKHLETISFSDSPPELSRDVHKIIKTITKSKRY